MAATQIWPAQQAHQADGERPAERTGASRRYRLGTRIWSMLHAQALLADGAGDRYGITVIEDDRRRLAGRRAR